MARVSCKISWTGCGIAKEAKKTKAAKYSTATESVRIVNGYNAPARPWMVYIKMKGEGKCSLDNWLDLAFWSIIHIFLYLIK